MMSKFTFLLVGGFPMRFQFGRVIGGFLVALYLAFALFAAGTKKNPDEEQYRQDLYEQYSRLKEDMARQDVRLTELERREKEIEALQIEHRLTSMETTEQTNHSLLIGASLAIVLMLIETIVRGFSGIRRVAKAMASGDKDDFSVD